MRRPVLRRLRRARFLFAVVVALALFPASAQARTWTVNTTSDPAGPGCAGNGTCSIRQALQAAGPGDTISIPASGEHYAVTRGPLQDTTADVSLAGAGASATVIDAGGASRVLDVDPGIGTTTLSGLTVTGGAVAGSGPNAGGAGIYLHTGSLALNGVTVTGNAVSLSPAAAGDGGAGILDASTGSLTLMLSSIDGNTAKLTGGGPGGGAGILVLAGSLTLGASSVLDNSLRVSDPNGGTDGGGGIYAAAGTQATIAGSTIAKNSAVIAAGGGSNGGAGVYDGSGSSTYVNDTISANMLTVTAGASNGGGAIFHEGAPGTISATTIAQNTAKNSVGGIFDNVGSYTVKSTIVAQNGTGCGGPGGMTSAGYNLEGASNCDMTMPTDQRNTNPNLGPLANNGGPTLTHALTPGSPAIDAGSCTDVAGNTLATDERGEPRPQPAGGKCDTGAFEYAPASAVPLVVGGSRPAVLSSTRASFVGTVNPGGLPTTARFQYGLDDRYRPAGTSQNEYDHLTPAVQIPGGYAPVSVSATVSGLVPAALYHVRLIVTNGAGSAFGPDQTFVTSRDRSPKPPVLGRYIVAAQTRGLVRVLIGHAFVPLTERRRLPVGTEFDARHGTVTITAAGVNGKMSATLGGAVFRLGQPASGASRGIPAAALANGAFAGVPSYAACHGRTTQVLQTLHASIGGRWRVKGHFSAGLARAGAQWATSDRCDGTLTTVSRGAVLVTNNRRHATFTLRSGGTHLARR
jgi:hypothetical protein